MSMPPTAGPPTGGAPPPPNAAHEAVMQKVAQEVPKPSEPLAPDALQQYQGALNATIERLTTGERHAPPPATTPDGRMDPMLYAATLSTEGFIAMMAKGEPAFKPYTEFKAKEVASSSQGLSDGAAMLERLASDEGAEEAIERAQAALKGGPKGGEESDELAREMTPKGKGKGRA